MKGHWFCDGKCNDVVNISAPVGRWDLRVKNCPVCHGHNTARWINHAEDFAATTPKVTASPKVEQAAGRRLFEEMRKAIQ